MNRKLCTLELLLFLFLSVLIKGVFAGESLPWGVERIGGVIVWDKYPGDLLVDPGTPTGDGIRVAVLDTGIDYNHPDLSGRVVGGVSYVEGIYDYMDDNGHGTAVAGVIAAIDNGAGIVGMAPRVSLVAVKVADYQGSVNPSALADAIRWSVRSPPYGGGAKIVSMSIGDLYQNFEPLLRACQDTCAKALLVAASGNYNTEISYPARYNPYVVAVGAIVQGDARWVESPTNGSNYGPELDFVAPTNVYTTTLNGQYRIFGGTSAAAPHVSGAAALIWSSKMDPPYDSDGDREWDSWEVEEKMRDTVHPLGYKRDIYYGYGLVNAWYSTQRPPADITYDHEVNILDKGFMSAHWTGAPGTTYDRRADINIDNSVDIIDLCLLSKNWGKVDP